MKAIRGSSLCAIALLVPALAGCGGSPVRESTGEYFDDIDHHDKSGYPAYQQRC
jgi:hypothetical protein